MKFRIILLSYLLLIVLSVNSAVALSFSKRITIPENNIDECQLAITTYETADQRLSVTLYPVWHVGEALYFNEIQSRLKSEDITLFEGIRPAGFFGAPFDVIHSNDPTIRTESERNVLRVQALGRLVEQFITKYNRSPTSLNEVFDDMKGVDQYMKYQLLNPWGHPFVYHADGNFFDILSKDDTGEISYSQVGPIDVTAYPLVSMRELMRQNYRSQARIRALESQYDFMNYDFPETWVNADIAMDMLVVPVDDDTAELSEKQWLFRNQYAVLKLKEMISKRPHARHIGILYGEGHMQDYHEILTKEMGLIYKDQEWLTLIFADNRSPRENLTPEQIELRKQDLEGCGNPSI